jgi:hypothetical protein
MRGALIIAGVGPVERDRLDPNGFIKGEGKPFLVWL